MSWSIQQNTQTLKGKKRSKIIVPQLAQVHLRKIRNPHHKGPYYVLQENNQEQVMRKTTTNRSRVLAIIKLEPKLKILLKKPMRRKRSYQINFGSMLNGKILLPSWTDFFSSFTLMRAEVLAMVH